MLDEINELRDDFHQRKETMRERTREMETIRVQMRKMETMHDHMQTELAPVRQQIERDRDALRKDMQSAIELLQINI